MKKLVFVKVLVVVVTLILLGACSKGVAIEVGENAPDFTLTSVDSGQISLSDFKGKVIILNFFASWCPPCREEVPDFVELQNSYGGGAFTMVGVAMVSLQEAKEFATNMGINYPTLIDDNRVSALYGPIRSIPTTFVIGKDFKIAKKYIGSRSKDVFENDIRELSK